MKRSVYEDGCPGSEQLASQGLVRACKDERGLTRAAGAPPLILRGLGLVEEAPSPCHKPQPRYKGVQPTDQANAAAARGS